MRVLSLNFRKALFSQEGEGEVPIFLLTITHPKIADPILLSTDPTTRLTDDPATWGTVSRSQTYLYGGIDVTLPDEQDGSAPSGKLTIQNVTRDLVPLARSVSSPPSVKVECVLASAPDTVEASWPVLNMSNLVADASNLTFDLTIDALTTEPFPPLTFAPGSFPGLYS